MRYNSYLLKDIFNYITQDLNTEEMFKAIKDTEYRKNIINIYERQLNIKNQAFMQLMNEINSIETMVTSTQFSMKFPCRFQAPIQLFLQKTIGNEPIPDSKYYLTLMTILTNTKITPDDISPFTNVLTEIQKNIICVLSCVYILNCNNYESQIEQDSEIVRIVSAILRGEDTDAVRKRFIRHVYSPNFLEFSACVPLHGERVSEQATSADVKANVLTTSSPHDAQQRHSATATLSPDNSVTATLSADMISTSNAVITGHPVIDVESVHPVFQYAPGQQYQEPQYQTQFQQYQYQQQCQNQFTPIQHESQTQQSHHPYQQFSQHQYQQQQQQQPQFHSHQRANNGATNRIRKAMKGELKYCTNCSYKCNSYFHFKKHINKCNQNVNQYKQQQ